MLIFVDSFDHYGTAECPFKYDDVSAPNIGSTSPTPRTGAGRLQTGGGGYVHVSNPNGSRASGEAHFGVQGSALAMGFCQILDAGTAQFTVATNSSGQIQVKRGTSSGTIVATSTSTLAADTWYHARVVWTVGNSGTITIYINGSSTGWITFTGDIQNTGNATWNQFRLLAAANTGWHDDFILIDDVTSDATNTLTALPGTPIVGCVLAQADATGGAGTHDDFTPSTGTDHGAMVDETPPDEDTTYNASDTPGELDTYNCAALGLNGVIWGVQANVYARKDDAGPRSIEPVTRVDGADFNGAAQTLDASFRFYRHIWQENPDTGDLWAVADVDGAEFGLGVSA